MYSHVRRADGTRSEDYAILPTCLHDSSVQSASAAIVATVFNDIKEIAIYEGAVGVAVDAKLLVRLQRFTDKGHPTNLIRPYYHDISGNTTEAAKRAEHPQTKLSMAFSYVATPFL